ncbi:MAG: 16S rRNA processing protein RimM [Cyanobacteria bacterium SZAS TMP-1]|nr:16S rRNA processing protein RimM [Cyanobacteria bacterium SZAS TMP-1]
MGSHASDRYSFVIGTVTGVRGLSGEMRVKLQSDFDMIETVDSVQLKLGGTTYNAKVKWIKAEGKAVLLRLFDYDSREETEPLIGATIYTQKSQLRELDEDEWWFGDLVGLNVFTTGGASVGVVSAIVDSGSYLLEIKDGEKTYLVPFVKALVPVVDIKAKRVEIEALPGLLE